MTWETELQKAENDTLRTNGDVNGIIAKYSAPAGAPAWNAIALDQFITLVPSATTWNNPNWAALKNDHTTPANNVKMAQQATRDFVQALATAQEWTDLSAAASTQDTLAESLGLTLREGLIAQALSNATDSPIYLAQQQSKSIKLIRTAIRDGGLKPLAIADLQTIRTLLGV